MHLLCLNPLKQKILSPRICCKQTWCLTMMFCTDLPNVDTFDCARTEKSTPVMLASRTVWNRRRICCCIGARFVNQQSRKKAPPAGRLPRAAQCIGRTSQTPCLSGNLTPLAAVRILLTARSKTCFFRKRVPNLVSDHTGHKPDSNAQRCGGKNVGREMDVEIEP